VSGFGLSALGFGPRGGLQQVRVSGLAESLETKA
jgi:hypothetical protein